jgi:hypothetical protein
LKKRKMVRGQRKLQEEEKKKGEGGDDIFN